MWLLPIHGVGPRTLIPRSQGLARVMSVSHYRLFRVRAFATWQEVMCIQNAA